jgi:hypothetical protein
MRKGRREKKQVVFTRQKSWVLEYSRSIFLRSDREMDQSGLVWTFPNTNHHINHISFSFLLLLLPHRLYYYTRSPSSTALSCHSKMYEEEEDFASFGEMRSNVPQTTTSTISPPPSHNAINNSDSGFFGNGREDEDDFAFGFKPTFSVSATSVPSSSSSTPTPTKGTTSRVEEEDDFDDGLSSSRPVGLDEEDFDDGLSPSLPQDFEENFEEDFSSFKKNPSTTIAKALSPPSSTFGDFGKFSASFDEEGDEDPFTSFSAVAPSPSSSFVASSSSSSSSSAILLPSSASTPSPGVIRAAALTSSSSSNFFTSSASSSPTSSLSPTINRATIDENNFFKEEEVKSNITPSTPSPSSPSPSLASPSSLATEEEMFDNFATPLPSSLPSPSPSTLRSFSSQSDSSPKVPHTNDDFFNENASQILGGKREDKEEEKEEKAEDDDFGFTTKTETSDTQNGSLSLSSSVSLLPQTPMLTPPTSNASVKDDGFGSFALPAPAKTPLVPPTSFFSSSPARTQESDDDDGFGSFALPPPASKPSTGFGDDDDDFGFGDFAEGGNDDDDDDAFADFQATPTLVSAPTAPVQQVTQTTASNPLSQMAVVLVCFLSPSSAFLLPFS